MTDSEAPSQPSARSDPSANRLAGEKSPYLLQHAHNPVDWHPWGEEAFERARAEDRPIFLSIGYATCHWCHVMERESFEDAAVAALLNDGFVSIKVDREERPDLDGVYMTVCQLMTGQGGWPLTVVMTPDRRPFFAGTYFPRETRHGRIGMLELLPRLRGLWDERREDVETSARAALEGVAEAERRSLANERGLSLELDTLARGFDELRTRYDPGTGGFGRAPRFPTPHQLLFLLRWHERTGDPSALEMVEKTLTMMRRGGIFDHVGFGFHRYSTDARWLVPHFEKMLYDQALLAMAYADAWRATRDDRYRRVTGEILEYVRRDLTDAGGAFYSAEDADSEGREGKFYVWSADELAAVLGPLGDDAVALARSAFRIEARGNFADEATGERTGENILHRRGSIAELAETHGVSEEEVVRRLEEIRTALFAARSGRVRPLLDDKILTDWNGLMIAAFASAAAAFGEPAHARTAARAAEFVLGEMRDPEGRLLHRYREGEAAIPAGAADHAFLAWGLIELYGATFEPRWLDEAGRVLDALADGFWDEENGGVFNAAHDIDDVPVRQKESYDGATPSANAVAWYAWLRLGHLTGDAARLERAAAVARAFAGTVARAPSAHTMWLVALDLDLGPSHEVVIAGPPGREDTERLLVALRDGFRPRTSVLLKPPEGEAARRLETLAPFTAGHAPLAGAAAAWVCSGFTCQRPTSDASEMREALEGAGAGAGS